MKQVGTNNFNIWQNIHQVYFMYVFWSHFLRDFFLIDKGLSIGLQSNIPNVREYMQDISLGTSEWNGM
jgi:hypothetical protein